MATRQGSKSARRRTDQPDQAGLNDMEIEIRKTQLSVEEIWHEGGPPAANPVKVATALAVVKNPFSGRYEPNLMEFQSSLRELGRTLSSRLIAAVGADAIQAHGKGGSVGGDGGL